MEQARPNQLYFLIPVSVAIVSMALFFIGVVYGWFGVPAHLAEEYCEAARPGLIKQPANTWSNISFIISGLTIGWLLMRRTFARHNNSITQNPFYGIFYASLVVLLGPGSMAMHATMGELGGFFDTLSMYLVASFTVAYASERFFSLKPLHFLGIFIVVLSVFLLFEDKPWHILFWYFGDTMFMFFISLTILIEMLNAYVKKMQHDKRWGLAALASILLAFFIWNITKTGTPLCDPYSPIQGHAIWHILDAVSTFCLFLFYASEHTDAKA